MDFSLAQLARTFHDSSVSRPSNSSGSAFPSVVDFGRDICCNLDAAESREWLVTNGIGGYAFGTIAGDQTRCYHGLLVAALQSPLGRTLLLAKLDETAEYAGEKFDLNTNRWADGTVSPRGYLNIERFRLEGATPVWTFALADALLEKRVFMATGANTTYVLYRLLRASAPVALSIKAIVDYAAEHCTTDAGASSMEVTPVERGLRVTAFNGAIPFYVLADHGDVQPRNEWYRNFDLPAERARGLRDRTDRFFAGEFSATLAPGTSLTIVASTDDSPSSNGEEALEARQEETDSLLEQFRAGLTNSEQTPPAEIQQLVLAADQFIVARPLEDIADAKTILAGYPWFSDWGRDTMVALPGLCLTTGRPALARNLLRTYARFISEGMVPNNFPSAGRPPEYNTADATLWYFHAIREYFKATNDLGLLGELYPVLARVVDAHVHGTRYNIHVDPVDGLLYAGESGVQVTWMDAKVGDVVVTPRIGKPVEINALWFNAVMSMAHFAHVLGENPEKYEALAEHARTGFSRFWNSSREFCFDVIDGPRRAENTSESSDSALRPNQIFAVSLAESPLSLVQQRAVVDVCARELLTSFGLRSLGRSEPGYAGHYGGSVQQRDSAYHQGTVWGWLLGPFAVAHFRVYRDAGMAMSFLQPMLGHIKAAGLGTASEIFDGDPPFTPNGCIAQAWTVGETLRAWQAIGNGDG